MKTGFKIFVSFLCVVSFSLLAKERDLKSIILSQDEQLFTAFNQCDLSVMRKMFSQSLEFIHDTGGITDYRETIKNTESLCARNLGLTRTLESEFTEIYPVKDYGAIQEGRHTFCHIENGKNDCGTFKFVHVWLIEKGEWKLARVISYDH